ncbi:3102_t:CDS:2, partial [Gigaspora rosea]
EIQIIPIDYNNINIVVNRIPGGNYSSGGAWRLPLNTMIKNVINGTNQCESIIIKNANNEFYMVFDQAQSQFGIASRSDIGYGPLPIFVLVNLYLASQNRSSTSFFGAINYVTCLEK